MEPLLIGGFVFETIGGSLLALPELDRVRQYLGGTRLVEARRKLVDTSSIGRDDTGFDELLAVIEEEWDGELSSRPHYLLLEQFPGRGKSLLAIHDEDSGGPFGDAMNESIDFDIESEEDVMESDRWEWICHRSVLDDWVSDAVDESQNLVQWMKRLGIGLFLIGALAQLIALV